MKIMKIQVLYLEGCPHHEGTLEVVRATARELGTAIELEPVRVHAGSDLARLRFLGSPTVLVDGVDVEPCAHARTDFAFGCRLYGSGGGVPPRDLILAALARGDR